MSSLLEDITVIDLTREIGGFCTKLLADMGARVIKVETPGGCSSRNHSPTLRGPRGPTKSLSFCYHNTNKRGITLDLGRKEARPVFLKLIKQADGLIESCSPDHLSGLRLGYADLRTINPKLLMISLSGFGREGPRRRYKTCDLVAAAYGGQMYVSGDPLRPPLKHYGEQADMTASLYGAIGFLLGLRRRARTGRGGQIDISMQEAVLSTLEPVLIRYFQDRLVPRRQGRLHWNHRFYLLPCKKGYIQLSLFQQWETLVEWMASEGMAEDLVREEWLEEDYRLERLDHVLAVLGRWTRTHEAEALFEQGQRMGFAWAPVRTPQQVTECRQHRARDFFTQIPHPGLPKPLTYPRLPLRLSATDLRVRRPPKPGEDNMRIYQDELGLTLEEIDVLKAKGVI